MRLYGIRYEAKRKDRKIREDSSSSLEGPPRQSKGRLRTPEGDPSHLPLLDPTPNKGEIARRPERLDLELCLYRYADSSLLVLYIDNILLAAPTKA
ncbi:hypothetical protein L249_5573 [Ophiocordyceps polyrhachis-furcata BCC 54312]|uniref:Uncharacterized protein n=1 Tax=Ophiocordyceps polyrhachis-furcata BCC 54312 TaxID=1330021 RepID=A0A367LGU2_9HYPO|nr:hypothetical protein L249_5573 [Ophiocordyceps polyrhachis-furcata BCC 54312]